MPRYSSAYAPEPHRDVFPPIAVVGLAAILAGAAHFNIVWNHFYDDIPQLFDVGWYAGLVYQQGPILANPGPVVFNSIQPEFYATHFSPGLWLLSLPSYVLPLAPDVYLALLEGTKHALIVLVVAGALRSRWRNNLQNERGRGVAALVVLFGAPVTGTLLAAASYPHFETWFVPGALAFFFFLFRDRLLWASLVLLGTVLIREDMGFHICGLLLVAAVLAWWQRGELDGEIQRWLVFAAAAFAWSVLALLVTRLFFPGDSAFQRIYVGDPPFSHLNTEIILHRLKLLATDRAYLWAPLVVYLVWAAWSRRWWVLAGYLAFVPWFALHFVALLEVAATQGLYYAFPYTVALLWPVVGVFAFERHDERPRGARLGWVGVAMIASIGGLGVSGGWPELKDGLAGLARHMMAPRLDTRPALDDTMSRLAAAAEEGQVVGIDDALVAFRPQAFEASNLFGMTPDPVDFSALYVDGRQVQIGWEVAGQLPYHYRIGPTTAVLASRQALDWPHLELLSDHPDTVLPFLHPVDSDFTWAAAGEARQITAGPGWFLPGDHPWEARFIVEVEATPQFAGGELVCEVVVDEGERVLASTRFTPSAGEEAQRIDRSLTFEIPERVFGGIQFRVLAPAGTSGRVIDIQLSEAAADAAASSNNP